jgi:hypothetical protein
MTRDELKRRFPNAANEFLRLNSEAGEADIHAGGTGKVAKSQRDTRDGGVGEIQVQKGNLGRFLVIVKSYRRRLLDQDNLVAKYHVDLCRYAGILPSDAPGCAEIKVTQEKVGSKEPERVVIEIYAL